jgi:hypothetical protein
MGMSFDEEKRAINDEEKRAIEIVCKAEMERGGDVDVEGVTAAFIQRRNEREEQRRRAEEQRSLEIERERSRRPPDPPDLPDPPPRHGPLGQPVIDRDGTYL